jgi:branched-chain amino acid transport system ATP-binding protein
MPVDETTVAPGSRRAAALAALADVPREPGAAKPDPIVIADGVQRHFGGLTAVDVAHIEVQRGAITALIGPNGAGKTTCFNLITKFVKPTAGSIHFNGADVTRLAPAKLARLGMVRSFQISAVYPHLSVLENVRLGIQNRRGLSFQFWRSEKCLEALNQEATELIEAVGIADYLRVPAVELPYGRKRALEIAATLALDPELMLLDEPMAGLGGEDVGRIAALIKQVSANRTVLMVEHNLSVVADLSDTITVLQRGEILAEGSYQEISNHREVIEAYLGAGHD